MKYKWVTDRFYPQAKDLRSEFQARFSDPKKTASDRFVWDYWHVPNQYTLIRTPAEAFFSRKALRPFFDHLGQWAWKNLGCSAISPPWLSYYVDGCEQKWHSDVPHGPWAFVYSLSPDRLDFQGGETEILHPNVLQYWKNFDQQQDRELSSFVDRIAPRFNRLVVFDPRLPHGVTPVRGVQDPRKARLVLHGWFTQPKPYLEGPLQAKEVEKVVNPVLDQLVDEMNEAGTWNGFLSVRIDISSSGKVKNVKTLANTLWLQGDAPMFGKVVENQVSRLFRGVEFPKKNSDSTVTIPLQFA